MKYWQFSGRVLISGQEMLISPPQPVLPLLCLICCGCSLSHLSHYFHMSWLNWSFLNAFLPQTIWTSALSIAAQFPSCLYSLAIQIPLTSLAAALSFRESAACLVSQESNCLFSHLLSCVSSSPFLSLCQNHFRDSFSCGKWTSLEAACTWHTVGECILFCY